MTKTRKGGRRPYIVVHPDGTEERITNLTEFSRKYGLDSAHMNAVAKGKRLSHAGFTVKSLVSVETVLLDKLKNKRNDDFIKLCETLLETTKKDEISPLLCVKFVQKIYEINELYKKMVRK